MPARLRQSAAPSSAATRAISDLNKRSNGKPDFETDGLCFPRGDLTRSGRARARAFMRNHCGPGTGREVQNRPFAFRRRAGAPAAPPAEEADEVDAPADGGGPRRSEAAGRPPPNREAQRVACRPRCLLFFFARRER